MPARFAILNACPKRWIDLEGDGRRRHCDVCHKDVHAIEQYTADEWERIWRESEGRACGFLSGESAPLPRSRREMLVGALLTTISPLMAQTGRVRIRVTDVTGAVVVSSQALLLGGGSVKLRAERADNAGEIVMTDLPMGDCHFEVSAVGFSVKRLTVTVRSADEVKVEASLGVGMLMGDVVEVPTPATGHHVPEKKPSRGRRWLLF